ncbi:DJ-1 family protein [Opisthorchis viverrini]|uniref:DJ-1 family protein n=1 Tax=Opisthorchis viverrini TaxID=6198 RepID=A0A1S8WV09_OPIVI|nr:DJ-1 family protein [Opisthorchis viverrini]
MNLLSAATFLILVSEAVVVKKALIVIAPGFEEIEAVTVFRVLKSGTVQPTLVRLEHVTDPMVKGANGLSILTDGELNEDDANGYDLIVLPGGAKGTEEMKKSDRLKRILGSFVQKKKYIGAICLAPAILKHFNLLLNSILTSYPSIENEMRQQYTYLEKSVVVDKQLITSRGPGTAMEFALKLVELLTGKQNSDTVANNFIFDKRDEISP